MKLLILNARIIDPKSGIDSIGDIEVESGKIKAVRLNKGKGKKAAGRVPESTKALKVIDATGMVAVPGLIDMHTHLREPGFEYKETIKTGTAAALRGGFTAVCPMPNTSPVNDNPGITEFVLREAEASGSASVYPIGAVTKGQLGKELAEMGMMHEAGCVAFSDDGRPIINSAVMMKALEYSKIFDVPIISHSEDLALSGSGVMNEGWLATTLGLRGIPNAAEEVMVYRDIALSALTGGRLHIAHVSTAGSVEIIRQAKKRGVRVTAETCPHYFTLTEEAVTGYDTNAKMNPPLRTAKDVSAIKKGLRDGTIDAIATDHAPHGTEEKMREFDHAPFGISGLETALPLSLGLVREGVLTLPRLIEKLTSAPAAILGIDRSTIKKGQRADIVVIDTEKEHTVEPGEFLSKGKNTPFSGWKLKGEAVLAVRGSKVSQWG